MRLGVLDIGSNTGHLLVVDAYRGAAPMPASSYKEELRLAEHLDEDGTVTRKGIDALTEFVGNALTLAEDKGCEEIYSFATSAVRDAGNSDDVLAHVEDRTGVHIKVLPGEDEARLTFLAVRRWFGWSSGRLAVFDIGGGSLEIAGGDDEVARRGVVASARCRPAHPRPLPRRAARREADAQAAQADPHPGRPRRRHLAARRRARPRGRHLEDLPLAGAHLRVGALQRGPVRTPDPDRRRPRRSGSPS